MTLLVNDPVLESRLRSEREASGADRYDEVWEGVYTMAPMPSDEHQQIVIGLASILQEIVGWCGLAWVRPGINLSDREEDWEHNYRVPDVAVFLKTGSAENCGTHWRGPADFLIEITSPDDRTREKLPFYGRIGVVELLIVDRESWALELHRRQGEQLEKIGRATLPGGETLASAVLPLRFRLVAGGTRPQIEVTHTESGRSWLV
jgi:Uma2 family endonuclease